MSLEQKYGEFRQIEREFKSINISKILLVLFTIGMTAMSCTKLPYTFYMGVGSMMLLTMVYRYTFIRKNIIVMREHMRYLRRDYVLAHLKEDGMGNEVFDREVLFLFLMNYLHHAYEELVAKEEEDGK